MDHHDDFEEEPIKRPIFRIITGVFIALLLIFYVIPHYGFKSDPRPEGNYDFALNIPETQDSFEINSPSDFSLAVMPQDKEIRKLATLIINKNCVESKVCYAKAMFDYVRTNTQYVNDPVGVEYVEHPFEILNTKAADCESGTLLLANLMESVGIDSQLVLIPNHAYLRIWLPEALKKYKHKDGWIYLDWTCKNCDFGEVPLKDINSERRVFELS
jgi:transglutaminase-like putative cysteine protease